MLECFLSNKFEISAGTFCPPPPPPGRVGIRTCLSLFIISCLICLALYGYFSQLVPYLIVFNHIFSFYFLVLTGTNLTYSANATILQFTFPTDIKIGMTVAYAVIFIIAFLGNSLGLKVVLTKSPSSSVTNLFIANMAIADLLLTVTVMPYQVIYFYRVGVWFGGTLGNITCKTIFYIIPISLAASVLTMMLISIDKFYATFYPMREKIFQKPKILSAIIWILSFVLMFPYALLYQVKFFPDANVHRCLQVWPWEDPNDPTFKETYRILEIFHITLFIILYALPLFITIIIYFLICRKLWLRKIPGNVTASNCAVAEKSKHKVVRLLVIIVVVFALCWFPAYVNHYFWFVRPDQFHKIPLAVQSFFTWLAHANSAINPCLYIMLNEKFRKELFAMLACCPCLCHCRASLPRFLPTKNDCNSHFTTSGMRKRMCFCQVSPAYTLPHSPMEKERGHTINLSLSRMSVKDDHLQPNTVEFRK